MTGRASSHEHSNPSMDANMVKEGLYLRPLMVVAVAAFALAIGFTAVASAQPTLPGYTPGQSVYDSYHNLGVNGPNSALKSAAIGAGGTAEVCVYCHTPHNATKARILWNREDWATYPNQTADFGFPDGKTDGGTPADNVTLTRHTLRCLMCHDGTTSVGQVNFAYTKNDGAQHRGVGGVGTPLPMTGSDQTSGKITNALFLIGQNIVGGKRDMSGNHPVSIPYPGSTYNTITSGFSTFTGTNFVDPALVLAQLDGEALKGDPGAYGIECGSCHDAHAQADPTKSSTFPSHLGQMIRGGMDNSNLCFGCHIR